MILADPCNRIKSLSYDSNGNLSSWRTITANRTVLLIMQITWTLKVCEDINNVNINLSTAREPVLLSLLISLQTNEKDRVLPVSLQVRTVIKQIVTIHKQHFFFFHITFVFLFFILCKLQHVLGSVYITDRRLNTNATHYIANKLGMNKCWRLNDRL